MRISAIGNHQCSLLTRTWSDSSHAPFVDRAGSFSTGRDWRCVRCEPSALSSPIRVELQDAGSPLRGDSGEFSRWPSVRRVSGCEITATPYWRARYGPPAESRQPRRRRRTLASQNRSDVLSGGERTVVSAANGLSESAFVGVWIAAARSLSPAPHCSRQPPRGADCTW